MITLKDYIGKHGTPPEDVTVNAMVLLQKVNALLADFPIDVIATVNSGWRPAAYNAQVPNAAIKSKHITGQAIDLADPEGVLDDLLMNDFEEYDDDSLLVRHGLYLEHPSATKNWCHLQSVPPRSGRRIFYP